MTTIQINEQVRAIQQATKTASRSKASALKFLQDAGIFKRAASTVKRAKAKR